jgi:pimeloyl-ACP methyl ester carboxylesterase
MRHIDAGRNRELSISRRRCLSVASALTLAALNGIRLSASALSGDAVQPFRIDVPRSTVARIRRRVAAARWPERLGADDWRYGANWDYMRRLADYWTKTYDWTKAEARLNRHSQYLARIGDYSIHFYHVRGKGPRPVPLILTHGWPGSFVEFLEIIGPLTDPARFGGSPDEAFDVVVPSIPGFGFSSKPQSPIGPPTTARLWHELMTRVLGYDRFGAQGGDWGSSVTVELARRFPDSLIGIHLNAGGGALNGPAAPTEEERQWQQVASAYRAAEIDYFNEQQHKPETVAFALYDNPLGAAAWIVEKFRDWSDSGTGVEPVFTFDQLLTNVMIYLVTDTVGTGVWFYRGAADDRSGGSAPSRNQVPVGFASFPAEMPMLNPPRSVLERNFNLVHYSKMPRGGHFACLEQPMLMAADLRAFFSQLRER